MTYLLIWTIKDQTTRTGFDSFALAQRAEIRAKAHGAQYTTIQEVA